LQAESDAPVEFKKWVKKLENECGINIRMGPLDNVKELVAEEMKDLCDGINRGRGSKVDCGESMFWYSLSHSSG
jgi:hypothetical protein